jgi:quinohemoprotein ethanol dehydrogenase
MWNGGTLSTAGNLVFQGTADGRFMAYSADRGEKLWEFPAGIGVMGSPVTYEIDGVQYVSVMAGWGGAFALIGGNAIADMPVQRVGRLLTFALGAKQSLPRAPKQNIATPAPIDFKATAETIDAGAGLFVQWCAVCHGVGAVSGGVTPDLRYSQPGIYNKFSEIVLDGNFSGVGMPGFKKWITRDEAEAIRAYLLKRRADLTSGK